MSEFAAVRNTAPLTYWLVDTFEMRWSFLVEELETGLQGQQEQIMRLRGGGAPDDGVSLTDEGGATSSSDAGAGGEFEAVTAPLHLDGHTMLWRAGWRDPCERIYDVDAGEVNIRSSRYARGDFSSFDRVYYTPQIETANKFLQFAKARHTPSELYVFQVAVPWALIESLKTTILCCKGGTASIWRAIVWHSRNIIKPPRNLFHVAHAELLIGDVASKSQISYGRKASPDELTAADALTVDIDVDGQKTNALQWVFQGDGELKFEEACQGGGWMHTLGAFRASVKDE